LGKRFLWNPSSRRGGGERKPSVLGKLHYNINALPGTREARINKQKGESIFLWESGGPEKKERILFSGGGENFSRKG